jgi:poly-gamma-glutamate synthesis protein (capsule biosynthesis protein)
MALARALEQPLPPVTRVLITGDIIPSRCVYAKQRARADYAAAFRPTADLLSAADITVGSLDASLSDASQPEDCHETFNLLAPPESVEGLKLGGFDVMTVATNHIKDCGRAGFCGNLAFLDTLSNLKAAGIEPVGGGRNREEAHKPVIVERNGVRFAFLGYDDVASDYYGAGSSTPGTAPLERGGPAADVAAARKTVDVVIVLNQWGVEYTSDPTQRQRALADEAITAGAAVVAGNGPHVVQAVEPRVDGFVAYALGNFVFDQDWSDETQQGLVMEATFLGSRLSSVRLLPVRIVDMFQSTWAGAREGQAVLQRVRDASARLTR